MFSHTSKSAAASSNVGKSPYKCTTLEEKMEVIRRMERGQPGLTVRRDLNMVPTSVTTVMENADKIKKTMETGKSKTATTLRYPRGPVIGKMEQLLSLWVKVKRYSCPWCLIN
jgi:hypothetical protein